MFNCSDEAATDDSCNTNHKTKLNEVIIEQKIRRKIKYEDEKKTYKRKLRELQQERLKLEELKKQHDQNLMDFEERIMWKSCCGNIIDSRMVTFASQLIVGTITILFCIIQLSVNECGDEKAASYLALFSFTVGFFLPQPKMGSNESQVKRNQK